MTRLPSFPIAWDRGQPLFHRKETMIRNCTCVHKFQDERYGPGKRVHNPCKGGDYVRCTVCGSEKPVARSAGEEKKGPRK